MKVSLAQGQIVPARLTTSAGSEPGSPAGELVLEVSSNTPSVLRPSDGSTLVVVEATEPELAQLRALGFDFRYEPAPKKLADDPLMRWVLPVGRSGWAIAAGYAGLFSLLILPAPAALVLGAIALWDLRRHPEKRGLPRAIFGLIMGLLGTIVLVAMA